MLINGCNYDKKSLVEKTPKVNNYAEQGKG